MHVVRVEPHLEPFQTRHESHEQHSTDDMNGTKESRHCTKRHQKRETDSSCITDVILLVPVLDRFAADWT